MLGKHFRRPHCNNGSATRGPVSNIKRVVSAKPLGKAVLSVTIKIFVGTPRILRSWGKQATHQQGQEKIADEDGDGTGDDGLGRGAAHTFGAFAAIEAFVTGDE